MHFYRIVGGLLIAISGFSAAFVMNSRLSGALRQTEALVAFVRFVRSQVECFGMPAADILAACDSNLLVACGFSGEELPSTMSELARGLEVYDTESAGLMRSFCDGFGRGYIEEQIKECDYYIELLRERRQAIAEALPSKKRVNSTLCISAALAAIILLI